jgi:hypothetical protein
MENKVPYLPITLSEFRIIQLAKQGLPKLLLSLIFLLVLNSCSKEATLDEVSPSSVETTKVLKEWAMKNDRLNQANLIEWNNSTPISLSDIIKGYSAPVKTASGYKEFITFELGGKRHGWYKSYNLLNSTDMQIVIQTSEGKTLRSGYIRKKSSTAPKGKSTSIREMNLEEDEEIVYDTWLDWVTISAPRLNTGGGGGFYSEGGFLFNNSRIDMNIFNYYLQAGLFNAGSYGGGNSQYGFVDYNYTEFEDNFTNPCFSKVLTNLKTHNFHGVIGDIIKNFVNSPSFNLKFSNEPVLWNDDKTKKLDGGYYPSSNTIKLSESSLSQASQEYIAAVLIHEILHAKIGETEQIDHTTMLREYIVPASEFLHSMYNNIRVDQAQTIFLRGVSNNADGYDKIVSFWRSLEISREDELLKFYFGHSCN